MDKYITVIGLEIHAELLTKTKIFCGCAAGFGGERNSRCCPICLGMPGTLPLLNKTAVEYAVRAGLALGCEINKFSVFDRKNYFYPDLPKSYQISQLYYPIVGRGEIPIEVNGVGKRIRINHIHLEEDAGKLIHDEVSGMTLADHNRCGIPLIEIVSEPDMRSAEDAMAYVEQISLLLKYAGVCDCKMEQGSLRCDVNISVMKQGSKSFGTRTEIKNINSVKNVGRAIRYEERRQIRLLESGGRVIQETRRYDAAADVTRSMRSKEDANDYRYFPEPDIMHVYISDEQLEAIRAELPEMPDARLARYTDICKLSKADALILVKDKALSDLFDDVLAFYNSPASVASFILTEFLRRINLGELDINSMAFTAEQFGALVRLSDNEKISKNDAKEVFRIMAEKGGDPEQIAEQNGYFITVDMQRVEAEIGRILSENVSQVQQYRNGEKKVFGFIMGQCTKALRGAATPALIKTVLENKLNETAGSDGQTQS